MQKSWCLFALLNTYILVILAMWCGLCSHVGVVAKLYMIVCTNAQLDQFYCDIHVHLLPFYCYLHARTHIYMQHKNTTALRDLFLVYKNTVKGFDVSQCVNLRTWDISRNKKMTGCMRISYFSRVLSFIWHSRFIDHCRELVVNGLNWIRIYLRWFISGICWGAQA